ncbi:MAG: hypothetical protein J6C52_06415, partial [Clostridia bacterium]|nr:hypothetical protein [Clostridia bacterium]
GWKDFSSYIEFDIPNTPEVWHTLIIDLSEMRVDGKAWEQTSIRQFRYYPFGIEEPLMDARCYIESISFHRTRAEAASAK